MHDRVLVKRILSGDEAAGESLITMHYARIYLLLHYLTGTAEIAMDLTQQTFAQAWQALASYLGTAKLSTWLHRIAYNVYTHQLRDRRQHLPLEAVAELPDLRASCGLDAMVVSGALAQLPYDLRETFLLHYVQELSIVEIAEMLDVPIGTVKSRLFTARLRMRELLQAADASLPSGDEGKNDEGEMRLRYSGAEGGQP